MVWVLSESYYNWYSGSTFDTKISRGSRQTEVCLRQKLTKIVKSEQSGVEKDSKDSGLQRGRVGGAGGGGGGGCVRVSYLVFK